MFNKNLVYKYNNALKNSQILKVFILSTPDAVEWPRTISVVTSWHKIMESVNTR